MRAHNSREGFTGDLLMLKTEAQIPACEGGTPVRKDFLVFGKPYIGHEEIQEVVDSLRSGWISTGPKVERFAKAFRQYVGAPYSIATNSCTSAMQLCLAACDIGPGDEVITTPMTFAATVNVIVHRGAKPVLADIYPHAMTIDPDEIERRVTSKTKAILPVHFAGLSCDMDQIMDIARRHGLKVSPPATNARSEASRASSNAVRG